MSVSSSSEMVKLSEEEVQKRQRLLAQEMATFEQKLKEYGRCANAQVKKWQDAANSAQCQIERERIKAEQELVEQYGKVEKLFDIKHLAKMSEKQMELGQLDVNETMIDLNDVARRLMDADSAEIISEGMIKAKELRDIATKCLQNIDELPEWEQALKKTEPLKICANELIKCADEFERQYVVFKQKNAQSQAKQAEWEKIAKLEQQNVDECNETATQWNLENSGIKMRFTQLKTMAMTDSRQNISEKFNQIMASCQGQMERGKMYSVLCQERIKIHREGKRLSEQLTKLYKEQDVCEKEMLSKATEFFEKVVIPFYEAYNESTKITASINELINAFANLG